MASHALYSRTVAGPNAEAASFTSIAVTPEVAENSTPRTLGRARGLPARRHIPPTSGHALEKLGHAIEYLTDEYVHDGCCGGWQGSQVQAIETLMAANRAVYYECPVVLSAWQRLHNFFSHSFDA